MKKIIQTFIVAGVIIKKDNKFLLVQEKNPKVYGLWNLPAGKVEEGDTIEETAIKEAREETGYGVKIVRKLGIFQDSAQKPPKHIFEAEIIGGNLKWPKDEILDIRWFSFEEIKKMRDKLREDCIIEVADMMK